MNARIESYRRCGDLEEVNGKHGRKWSLEYRVCLDGLTEAEARIVRDFLDRLDVEGMR